MAITATDIKFYHSGGASNSVGNASIGGAISSVELSSGTLHDLFDKVTGDESAAGDIEYRCIYIKNTHGTLTLESALLWISANTPSADTTIDIGLSAQGLTATATAVANESTAPAGVSFSAPASKAAGLAVGDLAAAAYVGVWIRRTVTAGAAAYNSDTATLRIEGDTAA